MSASERDQMADEGWIPGRMTQGDPPVPAGYRLLREGEPFGPGDVYLSNGKWYRHSETMESSVWNPSNYYPYATREA